MLNISIDKKSANETQQFIYPKGEGAEDAGENSAAAQAPQDQSKMMAEREYVADDASSPSARSAGSMATLYGPVIACLGFQDDIAQGGRNEFRRDSRMPRYEEEVSLYLSMNDGSPQSSGPWAEDVYVRYASEI